jgi:hypothetical protein
MTSLQIDGYDRALKKDGWKNSYQGRRYTGGNETQVKSFPSLCRVCRCAMFHRFRTDTVHI